MSIETLTTICIAVGDFLLFLAIVRTRRLLTVIKKNQHEKSWWILFGLMIFFFIGYFVALVKLSPEFLQQSLLLIGLIFLFGALFVYLVVWNGHRTISDLYETAVSKEYVENIIQSMADTLIVVHLDPESRIKTVNDATENLLGYEKSELIGKPVGVILGDHFHQQISDMPKDIISQISEAEVTYKTKADEMIPVLYSVSPVHDLNGHIEGYIIVGKDFRRIKAAQAALEQSEQRYRHLSEELSQTNTLKDFLLDIITHDIKNPVSVIQGVSELLLKEEPENEGLGLITGSTTRLLQVLNNATLLSRVAMHERIEQQNMDISELLENVIDNFQPTFHSAGMEIENRIGSNLMANANPVIEEIFTNYLSNAAKYAAAGGKVVISKVLTEKWLVIEFADFGQTIAEDQRDKVFIRSIQLEKGEKRGRGLGLAIVKYIAESLGARVGVRPNIPQGNIFYIELPRNV